MFLTFLKQKTDGRSPREEVPCPTLNNYTKQRDLHFRLKTPKSESLLWAENAKESASRWQAISDKILVGFTF